MTCNDEPSPLLRPRNAKETRSVSASIPQRRYPSQRRKDRPRTALTLAPSPRTNLIRPKTNLSDILVSHPADLLDIGGALGHVLEGVTPQNKLILLGLGRLDINTLLHDDSSDNLLADEVSDLDLEQTGLVVLVDIDVDREMGVDVSHLVLEALGHADDKVVDEGADGSEGSDILSVAVVDLDGDGVLLGLGEVDSQVTKVLDQLACFRRVRLIRSSRLGLALWSVHFRIAGSYLGDPRR